MHSVLMLCGACLQAVEALAQGNSTRAVIEVRAADTASNRALSDPSLLGLLYFPDEHLYAVYSPFFAPVLIPILAALMSLFKRKQRPAPDARTAAPAVATAATSN
jgi:phosphatidylinositol glycan class S